MDRFFQANEAYGQAGGDAILIPIATTANKIVGARGILARYGGDEFTCFFEHTEREQAFLIMEQVQAAVEALDEFSNGDTTIDSTLHPNSTGTAYRACPGTRRQRGCTLARSVR